jgi:hypothetical protein
LKDLSTIEDAFERLPNFLPIANHLNFINAKRYVSDAIHRGRIPVLESAFEALMTGSSDSSNETLKSKNIENFTKIYHKLINDLKEMFKATYSMDYDTGEPVRPTTKEKPIVQTPIIPTGRQYWIKESHVHPRTSPLLPPEAIETVPVGSPERDVQATAILNELTGALLVNVETDGIVLPRVSDVSEQLESLYELTKPGDVSTKVYEHLNRVKAIVDKCDDPRSELTFTDYGEISRYVLWHLLYLKKEKRLAQIMDAEITGIQNILNTLLVKNKI